jgi:hypothetical protein
MSDRIPFVGRRANRTINEAVAEANRAHLSGPITGTNAGGVSASQGPFGQVVDFDSPVIQGYGFFVVVVQAGPNGEADYTDYRYWAREVMFSQSPGNGGNDAVEVWILGEGFWGTIVNAQEIPLSTHNLDLFSAAGTDSVQITSRATIMWVDQVDGVVTEQGDSQEQPTGNYLFVGSLPSPGLFPVTVTTDGGSGGTATTLCDFTYTVKDINTGVTLKKDSSGNDATLMSPVWQRPMGLIAVASRGMARYKPNGDLELFIVDEVPNKATC